MLEWLMECASRGEGEIKRNFSFRFQKPSPSIYKQVEARRSKNMTAIGIGKFHVANLCVAQQGKNLKKI